MTCSRLYDGPGTAGPGTAEPGTPASSTADPGTGPPWEAGRLPLSAHPGVVSAARDFTAYRLAGRADPVVVGDAVLLVSEVVSNACRHAGTPHDLLLVQGPGRLRAEVSDGSPRPPRLRTTHGPDDVGGLGLFLVDRLALCWGWYPQGRGKVVWFEFRLPEP
ncbi:ATP-binding protein [Kitasatospora sp. NPDC002965]|uniref:ATP-binding protein n=1 Tax=Kitasatospora sp. NPDC002965 TaxID=3154775 RepID=UPI0033A6AAC5